MSYGRDPTRSRYDRMRARMGKNIYWNDIQRLIKRRDYLRNHADFDMANKPILPANDSEFLDDLNRRGKDYILSHRQVEYLKAVGRKLYP